MENETLSQTCRQERKEEDRVESSDGGSLTTRRVGMVGINTNEWESKERHS